MFCAQNEILNPSRLPYRAHRTKKHLFGSPLPTRNYDSWDQLSLALLAAGVTQPDLDEAQRSLKRECFYTFADIVLTDDQRAALGFGAARSVSASAV